MEEIVKSLYSIIKDWEVFKVQRGEREDLFQCYPKMSETGIWIKRIDGSYPINITTSIAGKCLLNNITTLPDGVTVDLSNGVSLTIKPVRINFDL